MKKTLLSLIALAGVAAYAQPTTQRGLRENDIDTVKELHDFPQDKFATSITAGTTQTQAGATDLTNQINVVTTVTTDGDGVELPLLSTLSNGQVFIVQNRDSTGDNTLKVYPGVGDALGSLADNTAQDLLSGFDLIATVVDGVAWDVAYSDESIRVEDVSAGNTVDLALSGDRIFHDTDADGTKDDGENWIDGGGAIFIEKHATSHTLSAAECYGAVYYVTAASVVLTLPAAADGMSLTVISNTANVVTVDADASDLIILDGTALDDGDSIDSAGAAGDICVLTYYDATGWFASTNTWVDGGP